MFNIPAKIIAFSIAFLLTQELLQAQSANFNNYVPLKCEGPAPSEFLKPSYEKYYKDVADIKKNNPGSRKERKLQKEFAFITNYKIDDILMSGKVLYGNKVSDYINDIADKLLKNQPTLKKKMRFYLLNVPYANALSTNNGIVFVTTGLIAQLENEAQLAFVLAHEISHFKLNHSFESYKKSKDILKSKRYDDLGSDEKILKILKYSKNNESEADVEGLEMFTAAGYDQNESIKMMDILLYSYLPFDEIPFPKNFFNDSFYKIPNAYLLDSAVDISAQEDEDDEEATHPNVEYRKSNLEEYIKSNSKGELYQLGKDNFLEVLKICRYEMGYLMVVKGSNIKAFYHAYLLEQTYGESTYTRELMAAAMYGINKYKLYGEDNDADEDESKTNNDYEGQISIVASLFNSLKADEFNVLAARTIYNIGEKYHTKYINNVKNDVFIDLLYGHGFLKSTFNKEKDDLVTSETMVDTASNDQPDEKKTFKESNSKVRKIKKKKKEKEVVTGSKYYRNAFISDYMSGSFNVYFDSINNVVTEIKIQEESVGLSEMRKEPNRRYRQMMEDERKIQKRKGKKLGIDSLIVIAPSYSAYYFRSNGGDVKTNSLNDELKAIDITSCIARNAKEQNLNINMIDINGRESMNSDKFNQYALISAWISEKYNHIDKNDILFSQKYVDSMIIRDGYKNVCLTGFTYEHTKHNPTAGEIALGIYTIFGIFILIPVTLSPEKQLDYYYIVYDLETGEQKMMAINTIRRRPKAHLINLHIAYAISQTKTRPKRK